jgi:predicted amidophosphoribosyltransferase
VKQTQSTTASHELADGNRLTVEELLNVYQIDESLANPAPTSIAIVDDVLTVGTHDRAMHTVLSSRFLGVPIYGIFIARRVFPDPFTTV